MAPHITRRPNRCNDVDQRASVPPDPVLRGLSHQPGRAGPRMSSLVVDTAFDVRSDTPAGRDPDAHSPTLRRYHQILWGRPLPSGGDFALDASRPSPYLYHHSSLGEFTLSSDSIIPTFTRYKRMRHVIQQIPGEEVEAFLALAYTIGGFMIWPWQPRRRSAHDQPSAWHLREDRRSDGPDLGVCPPPLRRGIQPARRHAR